MRVINKLVFLFLDLILNCNVDIENFIFDENKLIVILVIIILLKIGGDVVVECLLVCIYLFMLEI